MVNNDCVANEIPVGNGTGGLKASGLTYDQVFVSSGDYSVTDVYISPTGDDSNDGVSSSTPMKTFKAACDKYINCKAIRFNFLSGTHVLNSSTVAGILPPIPLIYIEGYSRTGTILQGPLYGGFDMNNQPTGPVGAVTVTNCTISSSAYGTALFMAGGGGAYLFRGVTFTGKTGITGLNVVGASVTLSTVSFATTQYAIKIAGGDVLGSGVTIANTNTTGVYMTGGLCLLSSSTNSAPTVTNTLAASSIYKISA
jgi:hypothetical protein